MNSVVSTVLQGKEIFLLSKVSRLALEYFGEGGGALSQGHEAGHLLPSSAMVKNTWSYTSIPQYTCMALPAITCPSL
jgi:hypothetical protein